VRYKLRGVGGTTAISIQELQQKQKERQNEDVAAMEAMAAAEAAVAAAAAARKAAAVAAEVEIAAVAAEAAAAAVVKLTAMVKFMEDANAAGFAIGNSVRIQEKPGLSSMFVKTLHFYDNVITYVRPDFTLKQCSIAQLQELQQAAVVADADREKRYYEKKEKENQLKRQRDDAIASSSMKKQKYNYVDGIKVEKPL